MKPTPSSTASPGLQAWRVTNTGGKLAAALALGALVVAVKPAFKAIESVLLPAPGEFEAAAEDKKAAEAHAAGFDGFVKQLDGRSLWWTPSKPGTDATVVVEEEPVEGDQPAPAKYEGPAIAAIVFDSVWFADGSKLAVTDDEKDGIKVVSTNAPWDAVIRYRGKEFTVPFFERDRVVFKDGPKSATSSNPSTTAPESTASTKADDAPATSSPAPSTPAPSTTGTKE
jgi:hypothetical protein